MMHQGGRLMPYACCHRAARVLHDCTDLLGTLFLAGFVGADGHLHRPLCCLALRGRAVLLTRHILAGGGLHAADKRLRFDTDYMYHCAAQLSACRMLVGGGSWGCSTAR
jgi:hypothetical protein